MIKKNYIYKKLSKLHINMIFDINVFLNNIPYVIFRNKLKINKLLKCSLLQASKSKEIFSLLNQESYSSV